MAAVVEPAEAAARDRVTAAALFFVFLRASLSGFGGGLVWVHDAVVERRRWVSEAEFADILSLCQFLPGPNVVGIAVCVGERIRGGTGAAAALAGFLAIPWAIGMVLGTLLLEHAQAPLIRNTLAGISAAAAGLMIAAGIKLLRAHRRRPMALLFAGLACALIVVAKLPLLAVLFGITPLSIAAAIVARALGR